MNPSIYAFMEGTSPYLVCWSLLFTLITTARIILKYRRGIDRVPDSAAYTELAGLPLTLLQSICFVWAVVTLDWRSALLFLWWGPGFIATAAAVVISKRRGRPIDWHRLRYVISCLCKGYYLAYMGVFFWLDMPGMMFAFSVWIINDQYEKAFMSLDADRLRRTFDDYWLFRILNPAGLLIPFVYAETPLRILALVYGATLLVLWLAGAFYVRRRGLLRQMPDDPSLLRNMVYFSKLPR